VTPRRTASKTSGHQGTDDDEKPTEADNAHVALPDTVILRAASTVDLAEPADEQSAVEDRFTDGDPEETFGEIKKTDVEATSRDDLGTVTKNSVPGVNESDSNFVAMLRHETVLPDPEAETLTSPQKFPELELEYPDLEDDNEWDDELDADGEVDNAWPVDHDDGVSNQSSATLSSTTSIAKRVYDELDSEQDGDDDSNSPPNHSPELKRLRIA